MAAVPLNFRLGRSFSGQFFILTPSIQKLPTHDDSNTSRVGQRRPSAFAFLAD
jgi:hypothetical protein